MLYENFEKWDMISVYIETGKRPDQACQIYLERYPERRQPHKLLFQKLERNLKEFGSFSKPRSKKYVKDNDQKEENVLGFVNAFPSTSSRKIETAMGVPRKTALGILRKYNYRPYHVSVNQFLYPGDYERRIRFCRWYIAQCQENENFFENVIWSDETHVTNCGLFNRHNTHHWADQNPYQRRQRRQQGRFGLNISCFIKGNKLSYVIFEENLNSGTYLRILDENLEELWTTNR